MASRNTLARRYRELGNEFTKTFVSFDEIEVQIRIQGKDACLDFEVLAFVAGSHRLLQTSHIFVKKEEDLKYLKLFLRTFSCTILQSAEDNISTDDDFSNAD